MAKKTTDLARYVKLTFRDVSSADHENIPGMLAEWGRKQEADARK